MLTGLHIEMNAFKILGNMLDSSGWTGALTQGNIASSGTADSYLKVSHVARTRHAHQVTASSLHILLHKAYTDYVSNQDSEENVKTIEVWSDEKSAISPQFQFWFTILELYVRLLRQADFKLYVDSLSKIVPCFFFS